MSAEPKALDGAAARAVVGHYISGTLVAPTASATLAPVFNPALGRAVRQVVIATAADVDAAVQAAKQAQPAWGRMPALARARVMFRFKELLEKNLRSIAQACRRLDIQLIADEIAVAFGRTGRMFACEWAELAPELVCLSKGLSGGTLPLAATLIRRGFEHDFAGEPSRSFMHSHSFTANPIACAAGLASLELFEREAVLARATSTIARLGTLAAELAAGSDAVLAHRQAGMVVAFDLDARRGPSDGRLSLALRSAALERGVLVRPLHDTLYWMPALSIATPELERLAEVSAAVVHEVLR